MNEPTDQQLKDILTTAVVDGINYWATTRRHRPEEGSVSIYEVEDDFPNSPPIAKHEINMDKMWNAAKTYPEWAKLNLAAYIHTQEWDDFDSLAADCFIQYVCFKDVIYG